MEAELDFKVLYDRMIGEINALGERVACERCSSALLLAQGSVSGLVRADTRDVDAVRAALIKLGWEKDDWNLLVLPEDSAQEGVLKAVESIDPSVIVALDCASSLKLLEASPNVFPLEVSSKQAASSYENARTPYKDGKNAVRQMVESGPVAATVNGRLCILFPDLDALLDDRPSKQIAWRMLKLLRA